VIAVGQELTISQKNKLNDFCYRIPNIVCCVGLQIKTIVRGPFVNTGRKPQFKMTHYLNGSIGEGSKHMALTN